MICKVLLPIPLNKLFSYEIIKNLKHGHIVCVQFKNKEVIGVVIRIQKERDFKKPLKKVIAIVNKDPLPKEILKSINFISEYTCNFPSMVLKLFLSGFEKTNRKLLVQDLQIKTKELSLTNEQKETIKSMTEHNKGFNVSLLHGVTGSGKTRVYMHLVKQKISEGFQCLILVPEIILTSEWVKEIEEDFGISPIIYHSAISKNKRSNINRGVLNCGIKVVIGTRSALSLPFKNLGLIVVDEEHDSSYKQDSQLIINFRDFAVVRAKNSNCSIILASATPSIESFYNVKINKYKIFKLEKRINNKFPVIKVSDMKSEKSIFSKELIISIQNNLEKKYQTLLFLNKRGYAPFVICKKCGASKHCKFCSSSLTIHEFSDENKSFLLCHQCNYKEKFENVCYTCKSKNTLGFPGYGIEKIEQEIKNIFPKARIVILSSDKVKKKELEVVISDIIKNKYDIIIGTQIISKGHNFPYLKTVGILNIDYLLNDFDFRSNEKAYQQIIQVSGRAGRKELQGEVFIQSFQPSHPVINMSITDDFAKFAEFELKNREKNFLPPFTHLISLIISSKFEKKAKDFSKDFATKILLNFPDIKVYGPAPSIIFKKNKLFRYRILIKIQKKKSSNKIKNFLMKKHTCNNVKMVVDIDPINFS